MPPLRPFHIAFPVQDLAAARQFYETTLGCPMGRQSDRWIDFDFFGHQITAHLSDVSDSAMGTNPVDGNDIPVRHWGVILTREQWQSLVSRLKHHEVSFLVEPHIRFPGQPGEQATLFIKDPSGNVLEFKAFENDRMIFAAQE